MSYTFRRKQKEGDTMIPQDPMILLSYLNTQLRDYFSSLEELCSAMNLDQQEIEDKMRDITYVYDRESNQFI